MVGRALRSPGRTWEELKASTSLGGRGGGCRRCDVGQLGGRKDGWKTVLSTNSARDGCSKAREEG